MSGHSVVQSWVAAKCSWKEQSILFSGLRGPDHALLPNIKQVSKWMRSVSQENADPSKPYMNEIELPDPSALEKELEHSPCHFVHHFADALAVIAYGHPDPEVRIELKSYHEDVLKLEAIRDDEDRDDAERVSAAVRLQRQTTSELIKLFDWSEDRVRAALRETSASSGIWGPKASEVLG